MTVPLEYKNASREFEAFLIDARDTLNLATTNMSYTAAQAVLTVFRRRLTPAQTADFAQVLPAVLRAILVADWHPDEAPVAFCDRERLTREVQAYRGDHNLAPDTVIGDVAAVLRRHVDVGRLDDVLARLPKEAREFWRPH